MKKSSNFNRNSSAIETSPNLLGNNFCPSFEAWLFLQMNSEDIHITKHLTWRCRIRPSTLHQSITAPEVGYTEEAQMRNFNFYPREVLAVASHFSPHKKNNNTKTSPKQLILKIQMFDFLLVLELPGKLTFVLYQQARLSPWFHMIFLFPFGGICIFSSLGG